MKKLTFDDYEEKVMNLAFYPNKGNNIVYPTLGLCGESGEIAEKIKKVIRDKGGVVSDSDRVALGKELGDVLWYVVAAAFELGFSAEEIASMNIEKLYGRKEKGTLSGEGDDR